MNILTPTEKNTLDLLTERIKRNTALLADYYEYERLLKKIGFKEIDIKSELYKQGLRTWEEYLQKRNLAKTSEEKNVFEVVILGSLLGLALAFVISAFADARR
jgi:hypothetical protein